MSLRINNNTAATNAYRALSTSDSQMAKSLEKLSSGFRINRAGDDAAGLVISEALRSQVGGLKVAVRNAQDGISLVQTAEGALTEVHSMLQRMRDLAVQASNGTNSYESVKAANDELGQLVAQVKDITTNTKFNGVGLLDGAQASVTLQVGANALETLAVGTANLKTDALGTPGVKLASNEGIVLDTAPGTTAGKFTLLSTTTAAKTAAAIATDVLAPIDEAIKQVSERRGALGAAQNRLEHTINNLSVTAENLAASESRIRDTDMAAEMTKFTKTQVLVQAGTAMLAQANSAPQNVLQLLRG